MDREWGVRLRTVSEDYFGVLVGLCLVVAVAGGYLAFTAYGQSNTVTETEQTASWESTATFDHEATVTNGTDVYAVGETLRNRTTYFRSVTPRLNGSFAYAYTATAGGDLRANASVVLVLQSVTREDDNATEYWRMETPLAAERTESLPPGEQFRVPFSTNVSAAAGRLERVDAQFGGTPGTKELVVEARLTLSGTRNGRTVETRATHRLPISVSDAVYELDDPGQITDGGRQTEQVTVAVPPGPLAAYAGPALLVAGVGAVAVLAAARRRGRLDVAASEREWLAFRGAREEFDDWITTARVPPDDRPDSAITVDSLEGLVDVAIDTDRRVLETADGGTFLVLGDDHTYTYDPPAPPEDGGILGGGPPSEDGDGGDAADGEDGRE